MINNGRLPGRAVTLAALAIVLTTAAAPAFAGEGKGKGKGEDRGRGTERQARQARGGGGAGSGDPAGNNGTMKVDGPAFDDGLGNEPHVACTFRLTFFGFDEGQTGDVTVAGHAPSGTGTVSEKAGVLLSDDPAGGGPNDRDAVVEYTVDDLDLAGLTPHPQQGYHLKVTLGTDTPGGVKHKVFWLEPCAEEQQPAVGGEGAVQTPVTPPDDETVTEDRTAVLGVTLTREDRAATAPAAQVLGASAERAALPVTGSFAAELTALGAVLLAAGTLFLAAARRRCVTA